MFKLILFWTKFLKKIHTLIFRSWMGPFLISFSVLVFILMLPFFGKYKDEIFGKGFETLVLAKVFGLAILNAIPMALPLAVLLSTLITMGNLGERYELAAMKANGISLFKIIRPMTYGTLILTGLSLLFNFYIYPQVNLKLFTMVYDLGQVKPTFALKEGHFYSGVDGMVIHTGDINRETDVLYKIKIFDHSDKVGNNRITMADSGVMIPSTQAGQLAMTLYEGVVHEESPKKPGKPAGASYSRFYFDTLLYRVNMTGFTLDTSRGTILAKHQLTSDIGTLYIAVDSMQERLNTIQDDLVQYIGKYNHVDSAAQPRRDGTTAKPFADDTTDYEPDGLIQASVDRDLMDWFPQAADHDLLTKALQNSRAIKNYSTIIQERLDRESERRRKFRIELNNRYALPFACIVFLFIGAPLGAIVRKGGIGLPVIFCIIFFVIFYFFQINGMKFARQGILPVWVGTWLPVLVLSPIAAWFTYSSTTDSPLLYMAGWRMFWMRIVYVLTFGRFGKFRKPDKPELSIDEIVIRRQQQKEEAQQRLQEYRKMRRQGRKSKSAVGSESEPSN